MKKFVFIKEDYIKNDIKIKKNEIGIIESENNQDLTINFVNQNNALTINKCLVEEFNPLQQKIEIKYPIVNETSDEAMEIAITKFWGGNINDIGNYTMAGHNYKNGKFFGNLKKLTIRDNIFLLSSKGNAQMYKVYDIYIVDETDLSCTSQETNGKIELTLITCDNDNKKRLVVKCRV